MLRGGINERLSTTFWRLLITLSMFSFLFWFDFYIQIVMKHLCTLLGISSRHCRLHKDIGIECLSFWSYERYAWYTWNNSELYDHDIVWWCYFSCAGMGLCFAALGDSESALIWLQKAHAMHPGLAQVNGQLKKRISISV